LLATDDGGSIEEFIKIQAALPTNPNNANHQHQNSGHTTVGELSSSSSALFLKP
jgi:hypothetical protein